MGLALRACASTSSWFSNRSRSSSIGIQAERSAFSAEVVHLIVPCTPSNRAGKAYDFLKSPSNSHPWILFPCAAGPALCERISVDEWILQRLPSGHESLVIRAPALVLLLPHGRVDAVLVGVNESAAARNAVWLSVDIGVLWKNLDVSARFVRNILERLLARRRPWKSLQFRLLLRRKVAGHLVRFVREALELAVLLLQPLALCFDDTGPPAAEVLQLGDAELHLG
ncbi:hypothetical protein IWX90DRAFT_69057 [Phyllosticta citrichinensis]|uniref:Uncharacterized protein n=1 Tax=Phyllosticta citrichinensis TaxID=1130410 RepID=A0ABR1XGA2_9PEZI